MRHSRPSTCKSTGKYLILKSGSNENGWGCRKEHSHKRKKHVFFPQRTYLIQGNSDPQRAPAPRVPMEKSPTPRSQRPGECLIYCWSLEVGSGQWKVVNRYIFNYMYMIYLRSCSWKDFEVYFEALWMEKKRDLQASRSQCETAKSCVLLKFSEYCQILGYINKVVSIYIYNIYIQLLVIFMLVALPMGLSETEATEVPATLMVNSHSPWTILVILRYANHNWSNLFKWKYTSYIWFKNLYSLQ